MTRRKNEHVLTSRHVNNTISMAVCGVGCCGSSSPLTACLSGTKSRYIYDDIADSIKLRLGSGSPGSPSHNYKAKLDARVVEKYDIKILIGKGSFSRVFCIENKMTKSAFALKAILLGQSDRERYRRELLVLRRLQHPYIVGLVEVFESKNASYLVLELAAGGELYDRIKTFGHLSEVDTARILQMVLEAVRYLHAMGVTHRDLKPENILFSHAGNDSKVLLTDFGLAFPRSITDDKFMLTACGTPEYAAPEVLMKQPYTSVVDLWAVGVIMYVSLSGKMPFHDLNMGVMYSKIVSGNFSFRDERWASVSTDAKQLVSNLLVVDPGQRYNAEQALLHQWVSTCAFTRHRLPKLIRRNIADPSRVDRGDPFDLRVDDIHMSSSTCHSSAEHAGEAVRRRGRNLSSHNGTTYMNSIAGRSVVSPTTSPLATSDVPSSMTLGSGELSSDSDSTFECMPGEMVFPRKGDFLPSSHYCPAALTFEEVDSELFNTISSTGAGSFGSGQLERTLINPRAYQRASELHFSRTASPLP